ncbi:MAG: hypothetical protein ACKO34_04945 [Vampirovibrionales bacterium]
MTSSFLLSHASLKTCKSATPLLGRRVQAFVDGPAQAEPYRYNALVSLESSTPPANPVNAKEADNEETPSNDDPSLEPTPPVEPQNPLQTLESLGNHVRKDWFSNINKSYLKRTVKLPEDDVLNTYLDNQTTGWIGAKYGALFGLFVAPALAWYCHKVGKPSLTLSALSAISHTKVLSETLPTFRTWVNDLKAPTRQAKLTNAALTMLESLQLVGGIGFAIASVQTNELKDRVRAIRNAQQKGESKVYDWPQEGIQIGPLTIGIHKDHASKPSPSDALLRLKQDQLDRQNAFWFGFKEALLVKVLLLGATLGTAFAGAKVQESFTQNKKLTQDITHFITHPIFMAKMVATPFIGGLVSLELVRYLNHQLRLAVQASSPKLAPNVLATACEPLPCESYSFANLFNSLFTASTPTPNEGTASVTTTASTDRSSVLAQS